MAIARRSTGDWRVTPSCLSANFRWLLPPYRGTKDNHPDNGLLLRADIHTLFDLDMIGIDLYWSSVNVTVKG